MNAEPSATPDRSAAPPAGAGTPTVVVIGNGMVGQRLCDLLTEEAGPHVVTFCEEQQPAYDRVHLSEYFSGKSPDELSLAPLAWYAERGIELYVGERATVIDRERRIVTSSSGREVSYDRLVLATGSVRIRVPDAGRPREDHRLRQRRA
jgi:nitrite reductase (NADH) large subunit